MSRYNAQALYDLLPAVYRNRDSERGYLLRDLIEVLAGQAEVVDREIDQLYENQFIETCDEWAVPYLGDLIGARLLPPPGANGRAEIAGTIGLRRRKGTAAALEQLAVNVTGWPARVVEYFDLLPTMQHMNHIRLHRPYTASLRDANALNHVNRPLDVFGHLAEVRRVASRRGKYNMSNVGLHLFRLLSLPLHLVEASAAAGFPGCYRFSVLGHDAPLFQKPTAEDSIGHLAEEANLPVPIRRRALQASPETLGVAVFVPDPVAGQWRPLQGFSLVAADLTDFSRPTPADSVAIDPVLGRLKFTGPKPEPANFRLSYHTGFPAEIGSGQYERQDSMQGEPTAFVGDLADPQVAALHQANPQIPLFASLDAALAASQSSWPEGETRIIEIVDSKTYVEDIAKVLTPKNGTLMIRASNHHRPAILLASPWEIEGGPGSAITLDGLLVANHPVIVSGATNSLSIAHCTLVPRAAGLSLHLTSSSLEATIATSILGTLIADPDATVSISDSILDATSESAMAVEGPTGAFGAALTIIRCTIIGSVRTTELTLGEDSIFLGTVTVERKQKGCVRYSWLNPGGRVPRRFHCVPEIPASATPAEARRIERGLKPRFTSLLYGRPGYAQLDWRGPVAIYRGASTESEMGAYSSLRQPQKEDALQARLAEFLPVQLEAGIFWAT
ncbi:hypothetical protein F183_A33410 [Bryobacterales bacterium F-183]|nr:hypothetical protein F183_A33410 [Bryobacterales bacterium F-183]